jgi:hypothetical protein
VSRPAGARKLPYVARERIADNAFLLRRRAGYTQEALSERATKGDPASKGLLGVARSLQAKRRLVREITA